MSPAGIFDGDSRVVDEQQRGRASGLANLPIRIGSRWVVAGAQDVHSNSRSVFWNNRNRNHRKQ